MVAFKALNKKHKRRPIPRIWETNIVILQLLQATALTVSRFWHKEDGRFSVYMYGYYPKPEDEPNSKGYCSWTSRHRGYCVWAHRGLSTVLISPTRLQTLIGMGQQVEYSKSSCQSTGG
jgi:hypothetical protein